jgi:3-deoxy-D-manno-octulosonic-acid transferase
VEKAGFRYCLKTELTGDENDVGDRIVIVDTMGELSMLYAISTVAFVGGSFSNTGGQNMLEPAVFKKPVIVGPSTFNFEEDMKRLRGENGVREVKTAEECIDAVHSLLNDPEERTILGENGFNVVQQFKGAVQKNLKILEKYI